MMDDQPSRSSSEEEEDPSRIYDDVVDYSTTIEDELENLGNSKDPDIQEIRDRVQNSKDPYEKTQLLISLFEKVLGDLDEYLNEDLFYHLYNQFLNSGDYQSDFIRYVLFSYWYFFLYINKLNEDEEEDKTNYGLLLSNFLNHLNPEILFKLVYFFELHSDSSSETPRCSNFRSSFYLGALLFLYFSPDTKTNSFDDLNEISFDLFTGSFSESWISGINLLYNQTMFINNKQSILDSIVIILLSLSSIGDYISCLKLIEGLFNSEFNLVDFLNFQNEDLQEQIINEYFIEHPEEFINDLINSNFNNQPTINLIKKKLNRILKKED